MDCARHESLLEDSVRDDVKVVVVTALQRSDVAHVSFPLLYMEMIHSDVMGSKVANLLMSARHSVAIAISFEADIHIFSLRPLKLFEDIPLSKLYTYTIRHKISVI